jgi:hypothetical protein
MGIRPIKKFVLIIIIIIIINNNVIAKSHGLGKPPYSY